MKNYSACNEFTSVLFFSGIKGCASLGFSDRFGKYRWSLEGCDLRLPFICQTATCVEGDFRCTDGHRCVSPSWVCDRVRDCDDGSDEAQCGQGKSLCKKYRSYACPKIEI